jgi:putative selenium metabolism protein SsnA
MTETVLLGNGTVLTGAITDAPYHPVVVAGGAVVWQGDRIVEVGLEGELRAEFPDARYLDARGGIVLPGFINLHHHFYSYLARGLDPAVETNNFTEVLDRLWWRLDRALDAESTRISAELTVADCVRAGCTTVFDHHASPNAIAGSLDTIAHAVEAQGLSAVLCYEVTDRNGHAGALAGIEENLRFIEQHSSDPRIRGMLGLHASFTLSDETLAVVAQRRPTDAGCHIHVAEDPVDVHTSVAQFGVAPVERLRAHGLLDSRCLLAHCIHLEREDYEAIAEHGCTVVHNPESNANNGVGCLDVLDVAERGCVVGLGTDGMSSSIPRSLRSAFLSHRHLRSDPSSGFTVIPDLLSNNARVARRFFDEPELGELTAGAPADIAVLDVAPPTTLDADNAFAHMVYGMSEFPVRHTVARGRVLLQDFEHRAIDPGKLAGRGRDLTPELWNRFHALSWGTSFLGR